MLAPGGLNGTTLGRGVGPSGTAILGNATDFTGTCSSGVCSGSIVSREYGILTNPVTCSFAQNADGALTQMKDLMRFGLMTFDSDTDPGVGVSTGGSPQVNTTRGICSAVLVSSFVMRPLGIVDTTETA